MDIHKPKPVHGLKDFLAEVGIIVLGVLIALGAEQTVEALHWAHKVEQAEAPLQAELHDIYVTAVERARTEPCLARRLDELEARILAASQTWAAPRAPGSPPPPEAYHTPYRVWGDAVWRSIEAEGLGSHIPREERRALSFIYNEAARMRDENALEWRDGARLAVLDRPIAVDPTTRAQLLALIQTERQENKVMTIMAAQIAGRVRADKLLKPMPSQADLDKELAQDSGTLRWCKSLYNKEFR